MNEIEKKINMNLDSLFIITADRDIREDGSKFLSKRYEYTFYRISKNLPTKGGKPMKAKEVFGSKARAKIAKKENSGYAYVQGTELFSIEDVGLFFSDRPSINGDVNAFSNFRLIEVPLPLPLDGMMLTSDIQADASEGVWQERKENLGACIMDTSKNSEEIPFGMPFIAPQQKPYDLLRDNPTINNQEIPF